jgi:hypothetical protein
MGGLDNRVLEGRYGFSSCGVGVYVKMVFVL